MVAAHVEVCGRCRVDVASFLDHRRRTGPELKVRYAPDEQSVLAKPLRELWTRVGAGLRLAYTAGWAVILTSIVLLLITSVYESRRARDPRSEKAGLTEAVAPVANPPASSAPSPVVGGRRLPGREGRRSRVLRICGAGRGRPAGPAPNENLWRRRCP